MKFMFIKCFADVVCSVYNCGSFSLLSNNNVATLSITGDVIRVSETFNITSEAVVSVPEDIQELIEEFNTLPDEARFISHYDLDISTSALSELTIIILAVAGGLVLLLIIILALVKMGFFRRRSIEEQENEDLKKETDASQPEEESLVWQSS